MCKEIGKPFENIRSYNKEMSAAMEDKLFFLHHLPKNRPFLFIDFGCADGTMIEHLINIYGSSCIYLGYDCSEKMIELAKQKYNQEDESLNVLFTSDWEDILKRLHNSKKYTPYYTPVLILSSVIHEVYSYAEDKSELDLFWSRVNNPEIDYLVIRDMVARKTMERPVDLYNLARICEKRNSQVVQYQVRWGEIKTQKDLLHFLLKYRWTINWERELNENYFPILLDELLTKIQPYHQLVYLKNFKIEFIEDKIFNEFGIRFDDNTHVKLIFKLKEDNE